MGATKYIIIIISYFLRACIKTEPWTVVFRFFSRRFIKLYTSRRRRGFWQRSTAVHVERESAHPRMYTCAESMIYALAYISQWARDGRDEVVAASSKWKAYPGGFLLFIFFLSSSTLFSSLFVCERFFFSLLFLFSRRQSRWLMIFREAFRVSALFSLALARFTLATFLFFSVPFPPPPAAAEKWGREWKCGG